MKQIDQDPRDYRANPLKGEPVFAPGAANKIGWALAVLFFAIGVAVSVEFIFGDTVRSAAQWAVGSLF